MLRKLTLAAWIVGLSILVGIILYYGLGTIAGAVAVAGWGLLAVTLFHLIPMACDAAAWRCLLHPSTRPPFGRILWMRWVGESINTLLPAAQVGGDLLRGRLAAQRGIPRAGAAASIVVDLTVSVFTLFLFAAAGVLLSLRQSEILLVVLSGLLLATLAGLLLLMLHQRGLFRVLTQFLLRLLGRGDWNRLVGGAAELDNAVLAIYSRPRQVARSAAWAMAAWILGAGEIWLALYFLGHPVGILEALILESLTQAVRSAAFPIPGALGVQEGGFVLLGMLVAVPAELALAASLIKRVRELGLGIPGLIAWQYSEGRRWFYAEH